LANVARDQAAASSFQPMRKIGDSKMAADRFVPGVSQFGGEQGIVNKPIYSSSETIVVTGAEQQKIFPIAEVLIPESLCSCHNHGPGTRHRLKADALPRRGESIGQGHDDADGSLVQLAEFVILEKFLAPVAGTHDHIFREPLVNRLGGDDENWGLNVSGGV
jgi:hypothetical protein